MATRSRLRALGVAVVTAAVFLIATRQLGCRGAYSAAPAYRAQVDAFLAGRLALSMSPDALAHDLAWTDSGVQQVWGLGVPLWQTPFELVARAIGQGPFPDRIALLLWIALAWFVLARAFRRDGDPWWLGGGAVLITAVLPAFVAMMRGRMGVYEEAAAYAYTAALILLGGLVAFARAPGRGTYVLLVAAAGLTGLIRPTVWFYGLATAALATILYVRAEGKRALPAVAIGAALFVAGGAALYATNASRFGAGTEFGHRLNLESLPGNIVATRFSYPFERASLVEAAAELAGGMFGRPEQEATRKFYDTGLHVGQSELPRWREYYFTTFSWPYLPLILAGLVLGAIAWRKRSEERWLAAWAVLGGAPLAWFYLRSPSISSRYLLDLAPAIAALLVIAWFGAARWAIAKQRGLVAPALLAALWLTAVVTSKYRGHVANDLVDRDTATAQRDAISRAVERLHPLPAEYTPASPEIDREGKGDKLYLNGAGWEASSGRVPPALFFFVEDPSFLEVEVEPGDAEVRANLGRAHLAIAERSGGRIRFAIPEGMRGLQVAFFAFGPDTWIDRAQTEIVLRRVRWR